MSLEVFGDQHGVTKLEVVIVLEEVLKRHSLLGEARQAIETYAAESLKIPCELCTDMETAKEEIDGFFYCEPSCVEDTTITMHDEE